MKKELDYGLNKYSTYIEFKNKVESSKKKLKTNIFKIKKKKIKKLLAMEQQLNQVRF